jgi:predicted anti-sigma-YlaC factor YlaD
MNRHLTTDQLVDRLYAADSDFDREHLESCADCRGRFDEMQRVKTASAASAAVSNDFLAAQRRSIYARLGEQKRTRMAWAPALAAAALLAVGIAVYRPASTPIQFHPAQPDTADTQLFADVYSMEQSIEPSVAAPIHTLFEGNQ